MQASQLQKDKVQLHKQVETLEKQVKELNSEAVSLRNNDNSDSMRLKEKLVFLEEEKQAAEDLLVKSEKYVLNRDVRNM